jgi:hypothetical protein
MASVEAVVVEDMVEDLAGERVVALVEDRVAVAAIHNHTVGKLELQQPSSGPDLLPP